LGKKNEEKFNLTATFLLFFTTIYMDREYMLLEEELIYECICGNRTAQKELYEKYSPFLFAICRRYMPTREDAEDVLVMGFTAIFDSLDTFKGGGSFESWMKRIIVNIAVNALRSNKEHYGNDEYDRLEQKGIFKSENMIYSKMNIEHIMRKIQQLPDSKRVIFNLYAIEDYSYDEISYKLRISIGTVKSQLAKARKMLQEKL